MESKSPVDFEYQIEVTKSHPEITVSPLCGDILGLQTTYIDFEYRPRTFATAECEIEIKTTEFDSKPQLIRVVGNAAPSQNIAKTDVASLYGKNGGKFQQNLHSIRELVDEDQA